MNLFKSPMYLLAAPADREHDDAPRAAFGPTYGNHAASVRAFGPAPRPPMGPRRDPAAFDDRLPLRRCA